MCFKDNFILIVFSFFIVLVDILDILNFFDYICILLFVNRIFLKLLSLLGDLFLISCYLDLVFL